MKPVTLGEIAAAARGRRMGGPDELAVSAVSTDSRNATQGSLFVALRGERFDAHDFLPAAARRGCAAAMVEPGWERQAEGFPGGLIVVDDTLRALGALAAWHRRQVGATVIAVTGSNGKTTVKRMIHHVLSRRARGTCSPKSFNNTVGVPLTLLGVSPEDAYVVCELGANAPGEIAALGAIAEPDLGVITCVGAAHLEGFGSLEGVAAEKASLLGTLRGEGAGVVHADSEVLARAVSKFQRRLVRFGESEEAQVRLTARRPAPDGQHVEIDGDIRVHLPVRGRHNAHNALAAMAAAGQLGWSLPEAAGAMAGFEPVEMRLEPVACGPVTLINDAYNANPGSVSAAVETLAEIPGRRKVLAVGDMLELGADSRAIHERTGREVAERDIDLVVGVGALGGALAEAAGGCGVRTVCFGDVTEASASLPDLLEPGDVLLLKGSRATGMERLIEPVRAAFAVDAPAPEGPAR